MEAKLKVAEKECYNKSVFLHQRKEESRDAVVPDTQPDIAEVLFSGARVLIRSKDVSPGRVRIEAMVAASVLYRGEDGKLWSVEVSLPVLFSVDDARIGDSSQALARLSIVGVEAKALNPRKILLRAEIAAEISIYDKATVTCTERIGDGEFIRSRYKRTDASLISAVTEKTFALTDEISLPPGAQQNGNILCLGLESSVEDAKVVGTKLIIKGKIRSRLALLGGDSELCHLEPLTEFSQIIELEREQGNGASLVWLTPSGAYCSISQESEARISLEFHMVAQLICREDVSLEYVNEVYSNCYELEVGKEELCLEKVSEELRGRESLRQLYESSRAVREVLYSHVWTGKPSFERGKMLLPFNLIALCSGAEGIWCEKRSGEVVFRLGEKEGNFIVKRAEIMDWAILPLPGVIELRLEADMEILSCRDVKFSYVDGISYDPEKLIDNSARPSLVLLRLKREDELWDIARENCSSVEAILSANEIEEAAAAVGKLILIPKINC